MHTVKITTACLVDHREPQVGDLYESTTSNDVVGGGRVYVVVGLPGHDPRPKILVNLASGARYDDRPFTARIPHGFRRLPPGTVVTMTVEED